MSEQIFIENVSILTENPRKKRRWMVTTKIYDLKKRKKKSSFLANKSSILFYFFASFADLNSLIETASAHSQSFK